MLKSKFLKVFSILFFSFSVGLFSIYIIFLSNIVMPWEKTQIIQNTIEWGGLSDLPKNSTIINIEKKGSFFTRQFIIEFESSELEIKNWIEKSKRLNNTSNVVNKNNTFKIYPGEKGSVGGIVEIINNRVKISMSWS